MIWERGAVSLVARAARYRSLHRETLYGAYRRAFVALTFHVSLMDPHELPTPQVATVTSSVDPRHTEPPFKVWVRGGNPDSFLDSQRALVILRPITGNYIAATNGDCHAPLTFLRVELHHSGSRRDISLCVRLTDDLELESVITRVNRSHRPGEVWLRIGRRFFKCISNCNCDITLF